MAFNLIPNSPAGFTVILQVAVNALPDLSFPTVVAVIVVSPAATGVTTPSFTVAILASATDHVTPVSHPVVPVTVAFMVAVVPIFSSNAVLSKVTPVTYFATSEGVSEGF